MRSLQGRGLSVAATHRRRKAHERLHQLTAPLVGVARNADQLGENRRRTTCFGARASGKSTKEMKPIGENRPAGKARDDFRR